MRRTWLVVGLLLLSSTPCGAQPPVFQVVADSVVGPNTGFWRAAGSDLLFALTERPSGQALLDRMAATGSHVYLRCHYTFSSREMFGLQVGGQVYSEDTTGKPVYHFERINRIFREFVRRGLKPVVEYDFLPEPLRGPPPDRSNDEGFAATYRGPRDWDKWRDLLRAFTQNLVNTFGLEEVRTWYFEVWNEPDSWPRNDLATFFKMYDVFADAVKSVDPALRVGGPACYHEAFLRDFLEHVARGRNFVTGRRGAPIDFISYHLYGLSGSWLNRKPHIPPRVVTFTRSLLWIQRLLRTFPELKGVEFHLNEWGLSSHFSKTVAQYPELEFRNDETSALFLVKLVDCLYALHDNYDFTVSLLGYWGFAWEAELGEFFRGNRTLTTAGNVPKPIQTAFELLARLGSERLAVGGPRPGGRYGVLATRSRTGRLQLLVYNYAESDDDLARTDLVTVTLRHLRSTPRVSFNVYVLDRKHLNTYRAWQAQGEPKTVGEADVNALLRATQLRPGYRISAPIRDGEATLELFLPRHSLVLLEEVD